MKVQATIVRCPLYLLETFKEKLEKYFQNYNIEDVPNANILLDISVYDSIEKFAVLVFYDKDSSIIKSKNHFDL